MNKGNKFIKWLKKPRGRILAVLYKTAVIAGVAAVYAFYKIITSVINITRARKFGDYSVRALRCVNISDALVSILALQTAMLAAYSKTHEGIYNAVTGGAVCLLTVALGIFIIINSFLQLKKYKSTETEENK